MALQRRITPWAVVRSAAIPVASALGEDEILVAMSVKSGASVSAEAIVARCRARRAARARPCSIARRAAARSVSAQVDQWPGATSWTWSRLTLRNGAVSTWRPPSTASYTSALVTAMKSFASVM